VSGLTIRSSTLADLDQVRALRLAVLAESPDSFGETYENSIAYDDEYWEKMASTPTLFLAEEDDVIIGMVKGEIHNELGGHWIFSMLVDPNARGSSAATKLVERAADWAKSDGAETLSLYVSRNAPRAVSFYKKVGFVATGKTTRMTRNPSILFEEMVKTLD
jgi:GNAT superfamily N-acetyltransferase